MSSKGKHVRRGVKVQHSIIEGVLPILEEIAAINGVKKVIPAIISVITYNPKEIKKPVIKIQRETISGFKLLAHSRGRVQEIFIVVKKENRSDVKKKIEVMIKC